VRSMVLRSVHRVSQVGRPPNAQQLVFLPRAWCSGVGVTGGTRVEFLAGRVLVILPPGTAELEQRVLQLMKEGSL